KDAASSEISPNNHDQAARLDHQPQALLPAPLRQDHRVREAFLLIVAGAAETAAAASRTRPTTTRRPMRDS
ncbi:MAG: hypothetical protein Q4D70_07040, partial [bacterium]|nr:hypothetical protein [bacterium]